MIKNAVKGAPLRTVAKKNSARRVTGTNKHHKKRAGEVVLTGPPWVGGDQVSLKGREIPGVRVNALTH